MRKSPRLMATLTTLFGLCLAVALATVPGCGPADDDAPAPTAAAPSGQVATIQSPLAIGGGNPGIKGCSTNCSDSFVKCAQSGADWNVCQSIYNICLIFCDISGAPVSNRGSLSSVGDAPIRAVGSATSEKGGQ